MCSAATMNSATMTAGTVSQAIALPYSRSACRACRHEPEPAQTMSGTIAISAKQARMVFSAVTGRRVHQ